MMGNKIHIKKDDKVKILAGKDRGKIGKVLKVDRKKQSLRGDVRTGRRFYALSGLMTAIGC